MEPLVAIEHVDFAYAGPPVLRDICLEIASGAVLGVIGPNGGGKTTLVKLLLGLLEPTSGTIRVAGLRPKLAVRDGGIIGYMPQNPPSARGFPVSVRQLIRMGLAGKVGMLRSVPKESAEFVEELIRMMGLDGLGSRAVGSLSGGQLQRAFVARAVVARPKLLVLDEPTLGVDQRGQQQFLELLEMLRNRLGLAVVLISHDLRAVSSVADRIACLNGTLHYHDVPEHLPPELIYRMFACDLEAIGLGETCKQPDHRHAHIGPATGQPA